MNEFTDRPGFTFSSDPPREVTDFMAGKQSRPSFDFRDVEAEEHAHAFTVAKAMQADVLQTIRGEVQRAIDEGRTFQQFQQDLRPRLEALGWWGRREMVDPATGKAREVQLGSPRRLRTIYQANMRAARAAGQWQRIERAKRGLPFLLYLLGPSEKHRPHHAAQEGTVRSVDDPFWNTWMPPNGWGCKCHVRQITRREAERRGITPATDGPLMRETFNPRTNRRGQAPVGVDAAWASNPGKVRQTNAAQFLADRLDAADPDIARAAAADAVRSYAFRRMQAGQLAGARQTVPEAAPEKPMVPLGIAPPDLREALGVTTGVVRFSHDTAIKQLARHPEIAPEDYVRIASALERGEAWEVGPSRISLLIEDPEGGLPWAAVLKATKDLSELYLVSFYRIGSERYINRRVRSGRKIR